MFDDCRFPVSRLIEQLYFFVVSMPPGSCLSIYSCLFSFALGVETRFSKFIKTKMRKRCLNRDFRSFPLVKCAMSVSQTRSCLSRGLELFLLEGLVFWLLVVFCSVVDS